MRIRTSAVLVTAMAIGGVHLAAAQGAYDPAFTCRAMAGPGLGDLGVSGSMALEGEVWLNRSFALGARLAKGGDAGILWGPRREFTQVELRSFYGLPLGGSWMMYFAIGLGVSDVIRSRTDLCLWGSCAEPPPFETSEPIVSASLGWMWHPASFLLSLGLHGQAFSGGGGSIVMPIGIGFSIPRQGR